jgi:hypothetical protein
MDPGQKVDWRRFDGALIQYYLARGEVKATASYDEKSKLLSVSVERQVTAYPDFRIGPLTLSYEHAELSADEVTVQLDGGLLKKVSSKTSDQTVAAVQALNALLGQVGSLQTAIAKSKAGSSKPSALPTCDQSMKVTLTIDVTNEEMGEPFVEKGHHTCSIKLSATVTYKGKAQGFDDRNTLGIAGFPKDESDLKAKIVWHEVKGKAKRGEFVCREGICFRMTAGYTLIVRGEIQYKVIENGKEKYKRHEDFEPFTVRADVMAPHKSRLGVVRFNRRKFVTNETSISFANGLVSEFSAKDPSEVVGFLQLPTEILKGVVLTVPLIK